jgi:hypothetical protein
MNEKWTLTDLHMRLDKLEQEIQWTRDMIDIIQEDMDDKNSRDCTKETRL